MLGNRYSKKPRSKDDGEKPFWISFADLMTALMTLFLVVMAVSLMVVTKKINEATQAENQRSSEILDICTSIQNDAALKNKIIAVDCKDNRINFGEAGRFGHNDYRLNAAGVEALNTLVPIVLNAANSENGKKWFKQIVIEGFTDTDGSYLYNLNLSLRRSEWVMCNLLDPKFSHGLSLSDAQKNQVKQLFLAGGVSFNSAKDSKEASRRVELRMQFYGLKEKENAEPQPHFVSAPVETCQLTR
ncbi:type I Zorya anti-phage system protein ZorB1 [Acinetobacter baumannii]|uniref:type I Zorya anti-phage system protein ZorB1 n=1 Tax=Acinetobacter baumannii TaxID=470 RepID=UPI000DE5E664|nr:type I Zorya anti-phage system protein ZorB1 [Acinetobacter baumannii]ELY3912503.1 OmpA family protein [Acinetobacter baumannii]MBA2959119.1 OmpA family protein [Acinetobacter baumannii]MBA2974154.1 OmpA family protein [Acinetobacter baumannii]MCJ8825575.1 OmpA family protein [Acinetobacter baumannii]MCJ8838419.1 OmpA family protein [Acinetobacter baumannii]